MAITYPINKEVDRFTVYCTTANSPVLDGNGKQMTGVVWGSNNLDQMISNLATDVKWLIEVREPRPSFDSLTQKLKRLPVDYDVANETATMQSWEVVALTQEEIDAKLPAHYTTTTPVSGIKLSTSLESQNAFTRMVTLVNQAQLPDTDIVKVNDILGEAFELTVSDFNVTMVAYGQHCYELFHAVPEVTEDPDMI